METSISTPDGRRNETVHAPAEATKEMITSPDPTPTFPDGGLEGWGVVLGGAIAMCVSFGAVTSCAVFQEYYARTVLRYRSQSDIAWISSVQLALMFGMILPSSHLLTLGGPRLPLILGTTFLFVGNMCASAATTWIEFLFSQGICAGIGEGLIMLPAITMPVEWFLLQRSLVSGLVAAGSAFGGVILPIAINRLLNTHHVSLPWTLRFVAFVQLGGMAIALSLIKQRFSKAEVQLPWRAWLSSRSMLAQYIPYIFIAVFAVRRGAHPSLAFYFTSVMNSGAVVGRLCSGFLGDRFGCYNSLALAAFLSGVIALTQTAAISITGILVWALAYGTISGSLQSLLTPAMAFLAPEPAAIGGYVALSGVVLCPALLASQPVAGALLNIGGEDRDFLAQSLFTGSLCVIGSVFVLLSRAQLPDTLSWKR
ncbi:hypothetical protein OC845_001772 [Tilletia horrida]|nr:hypothetical protein OC845_001772 [Tilletia horrida]